MDVASPSAQASTFFQNSLGWCRTKCCITYNIFNTVIIYNIIPSRDDSCALMLDAGEVPCSADTPVQADCIPVKELRGKHELFSDIQCFSIG